MTIPTNILALIFVLSFLIVFHEGGHFVVAKLFKFPVEVFSLGFGKRLFGWKRKETDYRVSLIPLGGYVKVVGLGPDESDVVAGTAEAAVPAGDAPPAAPHPLRRPRREPRPRPPPDGPRVPHRRRGREVQESSRPS